MADDPDRLCEKKRLKKVEIRKALEFGEKKVRHNPGD
jgi:hypothetical protein